MYQRMRLVLCLVFLIAGALFALLGAVTLTLVAALRPPGDHSDAAWGGLVYFVIAAVCFFAGWRLRLPRQVARAFEVIPKPTGRTTE